MPQVISLSSQGRGNSPELVVLVKREAGLRAGGADVASLTGADTTSLSSLLSSHGAVMQPMFGLSEDRTQAHVASLIESLQGDVTLDTQPVLNLPMFYRIAAAEDQLDRLANELLAHDLVEAAYVKPAGAPPTVAEAQRIQSLNDMQPDAGDAPPVTPNFVANQGYLTVAPGGIDAPFAWTIPGGGGSGSQDNRLRMGVAIHSRGPIAESGWRSGGHQHGEYRPRDRRPGCHQRRSKLNRDNRYYPGRNDQRVFFQRSVKLTGD